MNSRPQFGKRLTDPSGTVVVFALVILAVGALVMAGWVHFMAARVERAEQIANQVKRRITLENSRLMASQYILQNILPTSYSGPATITTTWGSFSITTLGTAVPLESSTMSISTLINNHFSPGSIRGFTTDLGVQLGDGVTNYSWRFRARSRSPIFAYDQVTIQKPFLGTPVVSGAPVVPYNVMVRAPGTYTFTAAGTYQSPNVLSYTMAPSNKTATYFAFPPVTSGTTATGNYDGSISVISVLQARGGQPLIIDPTPSATNSANSITTGTTGVVTVDLTYMAQTATVGTNAYAKAIINSGTKSFRIDLKGAPDAATTLPVVLVVPNAANLTNISLSGTSNTRRVYVAVKSRPTLTISGTGSWRLAGVFEQTGLSITPGPLQITGGFRTDSNITVSGGTLTINRESDASSAYLESYVDRIGWLESFRQ